MTAERNCESRSHALPGDRRLAACDYRALPRWLPPHIHPPTASSCPCRAPSHAHLRRRWGSARRIGTAAPPPTRRCSLVPWLVAGDGQPPGSFACAFPSPSCCAKQSSLTLTAPPIRPRPSSNPRNIAVGGARSEPGPPHVGEEWGAWMAAGSKGSMDALRFCGI
jgi:hypothetical protein